MDGFTNTMHPAQHGQPGAAASPTTPNASTPPSGTSKGSSVQDAAFNDALNQSSMAGSQTKVNFAQIGTIFNDATTRLNSVLTGGDLQGDPNAIVKDLQTTQTDLNQLIQNHPNQFQGATGIHAKTIANQLNLEIQSIQDAGQNPFATREINDVHRDILDIVNNDPRLKAAATQGNVMGFTAAPPPVNKATPFQDNDQQTAFLNQFIKDANHLGNAAIKLVGQQMSDPNGSAAQKLVGQIQTFAQNADAFGSSQGGIYTARFANELLLDGTNGTAAQALVDGIQTGNVKEVRAAANVLATNATDLAGNMTPVTGGMFATTTSA